VTTDVIMVPFFPYLAVRYGVTDVPATVVNGRLRIVGPRDEAEYVDALLATA
jgi:predicted DsbA family dithiol-disulfide isomerase